MQRTIILLLVLSSLGLSRTGAEVTIEAVDPVATEAGPDHGIFRFTRSDTSQDITVQYKVTGSVYESDYLPELPGFVDIPQGKAFTEIRVEPAVDGESEPPEEIGINLLPGDGYVVGKKNYAKITIYDNDDQFGLNLVAIDTFAHEKGSDPATVRIFHTPAAYDLNVHYHLSGTASPADYSILQTGLLGRITLAKGEAFTDIQITPKDDQEAEGPETLTFTLTTDVGYSLGNDFQATLTILDDDGPVKGQPESVPFDVEDRSGPIARSSTPVVLEGKQLPGLQGADPKRLAAFRFEKSWVQIPVQIDERLKIDSGVVRDTETKKDGVNFLWYADAGTYTGPDRDPTFDVNDELVFMARDSGGVAPAGAGNPPGTLAGGQIQIEITDPLSHATGTVYVFKSDETLSPDAGKNYVDYRFNLLAGPYLEAYRFEGGPNLEDSYAETAFYKTRFIDRWIRDGIWLGAKGPDILDRDRIGSANGRGHCEEFWCEADSRGSFIVNKDGPVRAIRSYLGAKTGNLLQREHKFYDRHEESQFHMRLQSIPGITLHVVHDYSQEATGMTYQNSLTEKPMVIDGRPDPVPIGIYEWEQVDGDNGTLIITTQWETDIVGGKISSYYVDDFQSGRKMANGDEFEYANSGLVWSKRDGLPNTDPRLEKEAGGLNHLGVKRILHYLPPNSPPKQAERIIQERTNPLVIEVK